MSRYRQAFLYAANAAKLINLAKLVVAVAAVLGSETAEVMVATNTITRGLTVFRPAKDGQSPRVPPRHVSRYAQLNQKVMLLLSLLMMFIW